MPSAAPPARAGTLEPPPPTPTVWVLYVDLDAYYVSCEIRDRPELAQARVLVGPPPAAGPSRGVVLSASYAARTMGVHSAMPAAIAARLCPDAIWIPPDFAKYERISREVRDVLARHAVQVVPYGIDEAAVQVDVASADAARDRAVRLQEEIRRELRLPASIGVATSRIVAKIASDRAKPAGVVVVRPDEVASFLAPLPVRAIPGVGPKTEETLHLHGIATVGELAARSPADLARSLGRFGRDLIQLARGHPVEGPVETWEPHSRSTDRTFGTDIEAWDPIAEAVERMAGDLAESLGRESLRYGSVGVGFRWADFTRTQRVRSLGGAQEGPAALRHAALRLARELWEVDGARGRRPVRTISVRAERLAPRHQRQRRLDEADRPGAGAK